MKVVVAVDVDEVVASLHVPWLARYNRDYDDILSLSMLNRWEYDELVKPECGIKILEYLHDKDLYEHVPPVPGALAGVTWLRDNGARVVFVTSCVKGMIDQKMEWLVEHRFIESQRLMKDLIPATDKSLVRADILIDDAVHNVKSFLGHRILFDRPWNKHCLVPCHRAYGWLGVLRTVSDHELLL